MPGCVSPKEPAPGSESLGRAGGCIDADENIGIRNRPRWLAIGWELLCLALANRFSLTARDSQTDGDGGQLCGQPDPHWGEGASGLTDPTDARPSFVEERLLGSRPFSR